MKLRELRQRSAGEGTVWPPRWVGPSGPGQVPEDGVLEGLERLGNRCCSRSHPRATAHGQPPMGHRELSTRGR
jgi:hypothetical protein